MTMRSSQLTSVGSPRRGVVLLAVLVVLAVLILVAYRVSQSMTSEARATDSYVRQMQAQALAESGIHYVMAILTNPSTTVTSGNLICNPTLFQDIVILDSDTPGNKGMVSILALYDPDTALNTNPVYRYGLEDESSKINPNALMQLDPSGTTAYNVLMNLNDSLGNALLTEDVVNSILDWLDSDDTTRSDGAEDDYYMALDPPYHCKNAPLDSLEELLYVKGMTWQLLFGNDRNRNGVLDPDEDDGTGQVNQGCQAYLTIFSREQNVSSAGQQRINVNDSDLTTLLSNLTTAVGEDLAAFIVGYRIYGPATQIVIQQ